MGLQALNTTRPHTTDARRRRAITRRASSKHVPSRMPAAATFARSARETAVTTRNERRASTRMWNRAGFSTTRCSLGQQISIIVSDGTERKTAAKSSTAPRPDQQDGVPVTPDRCAGDPTGNHGRGKRARLQTLPAHALQEQRRSFQHRSALLRSRRRTAQHQTRTQRSQRRSRTRSYQQLQQTALQTSAPRSHLIITTANSGTRSPRTINGADGVGAAFRGDGANNAAHPQLRKKLASATFTGGYAVAASGRCTATTLRFRMRAGRNTSPSWHASRVTSASCDRERISGITIRAGASGGGWPGAPPPQRRRGHGRPISREPRRYHVLDE